jgi:hypothetical protein
MPSPELHAAYVQHTKKMIADLRAELAPYLEGRAKAGRRTAGGWEDITEFRVAQIIREVAALEGALIRHNRLIEDPYAKKSPPPVTK